MRQKSSRTVVHFSSLTQRNIFKINLVNLYTVWTVIALFRLIWCRTDFRFVNIDKVCVYILFTHTYVYATEYVCICSQICVRKYILPIFMYIFILIEFIDSAGYPFQNILELFEF